MNFALKSKLPALVASGPLIWAMTKREVAARYRGSFLGVVWSVLNPLFMLTLYTLVFGVVYQSRWLGTSDHSTTGEFGLTLFAGLIVFNFFSEVVVRAPMLVPSNVNFVKKVVFPLEVLSVISVLSALTQAGVSVVVLLSGIYVLQGSIPLSVLWLPVIIMPVLVMALGVSWFLAALGVFIRDIPQFMGPLISALLFLSPIFFPLEALPEQLRMIVLFNPISVPVEAMRGAVIFGTAPDVTAWLMYSAVAILASWAGYRWFQATRKGFADVL